MTTDIESYFDQTHAEITAWRRHLHARPGLLYDVADTADFVADKLRDFGVDDVVTGLGQTGVVGLIRGRMPAANSAIGLRADMDALPIVEAKYLAETRDFKDTIAAIFQPAKEGGNGAKAMLDDEIIPLGCSYWVRLAQTRGAALMAQAA